MLLAPLRQRLEAPAGVGCLLSGRREQARQANVLERLAGECKCGRKTMDEIARWITEEGVSVPNGNDEIAAGVRSPGGGSDSLDREGIPFVRFAATVMSSAFLYWYAASRSEGEITDLRGSHREQWRI